MSARHRDIDRVVTSRSFNCVTPYVDLLPLSVGKSLAIQTRNFYLLVTLTHPHRWYERIRRSRESDFVKCLDSNGHRENVLNISRILSASHAQHRSDVDLSTARVRRDSRAFAETHHSHACFLGQEQSLHLTSIYSGLR